MLLNNIINNKMKEGEQMKDFKKNKIAENRGITLMALIVTIIVLLILAGISLHMLRRRWRNIFTSIACKVCN